MIRRRTASVLLCLQVLAWGALAYSQPAQGSNAQPDPGTAAGQQQGSTQAGARQPAPPPAPNPIVPSNDQHPIKAFLLKAFNDPIAWLTAAIALIACGQWRVYSQMRDHARVTERAYVSVSPHKPGLHPVSEPTPNEEGGQTHRLSLRFKVQNYGNTPAEITRSVFQCQLTNMPLPAAAEYLESEGRDGRVSLVKDDNYTITVPYEFKTTGVESFSHALRELADNGHRLYVIGYLDYLDRFGERHRCGFARIYEPSFDDRTRPEYQTLVKSERGPSELLRFLRFENQFNPTAYLERQNLILVTAPGYNYDEPRKRGHGTDW